MNSAKTAGRLAALEKVVKHGIALLLPGGVLAFAGASTLLGGAFLHRWLTWPALGVGASLLLLGNLYLVRAAGVEVERFVAWFPGCLLVLPYSIAAAAALGLYRAFSPEPFADEIAPRLWLGSAPLAFGRADVDRIGAGAVLNVCAEFGDLAGLGRDRPYRRVPMFDGLAPTPRQLDEAVAWAAEQHRAGKVVLVHCAQGHGRSATVMAALLAELGIDGAEAALERIRKARPGARPSAAQRDAVIARGRRST